MVDAVAGSILTDTYGYIAAWWELPRPSSKKKPLIIKPTHRRTGPETVRRCFLLMDQKYLNAGMKNQKRHTFATKPSQNEKQAVKAAADHRSRWGGI